MKARKHPRNVYPPWSHSLVTTAQAEIVERLLAKGWIEPWNYRRSIYLFLPDIIARKCGHIYRDHTRKPIRVTESGRIIAGYA